MLLAVDFYEDFIDVEGVAVASVFAVQPAGINGAEFYAPQADRFSGYGDAPFSQEVFYISVAEVEPEVEPDCVGNNIGRESVAFVSIHLPILPIPAS